MSYSQAVVLQSIQEEVAICEVETTIILEDDY